MKQMHSIALVVLLTLSHLKGAVHGTTNLSHSLAINTERLAPESKGINNSFSKISRNLAGGKDSAESITVVPSFSYQFHTNDHEHLDRIVLAHQSGNDAVANGDNGGGLSSGGGNIVETLSNSNSAGATRRQDTFSSSNYPSTYAAGGVSTSSLGSHVPYHTQQNQDWMGGFVRNTDLQSKQQRSDQQRVNVLWPKPQAEKQSAHLSQIPTDSRNNNAVSPINKPAYFGAQAWRNFSDVLQTTQSPRRQSSLRRSKSTTFSSSSTPTVRPQDINRRSGVSGLSSYQIPHYQGYQHQLQAGNPTSNPNTPSQRIRSQLKKQKSTSSSHKTQKKRKILSSRADSYQQEYGEMVDDADDDEMNETNADHYHHDHEHYGNEEDDQDDDADDGNDNEYYYGQDFPALRDIPPGGGPFGPGGPAAGGPLPPPPVPVKGSIDYILIPLILIGLAGPIFVVLYVVLGAFEFKIAPIARSFQGSYAEYQPYIDSVTSSVGRALEKYECIDYATCKLRGFSNQFDLFSSTDSINSPFNMKTIESALTSFTPPEYQGTLRGAFDLLKKPQKTESCQKYKCSGVLDTLSASF